MGNEIRLFLVIDAFSGFSGMALVNRPDFRGGCWV